MFNFGLRSRLILLVTLVLLPVLGMLLISANEQRTEAVAAAQAEVLQLARLAADDYYQTILGAQQFLEMLAHTSVMATLDQEACGPFVAEFQQRYPQYHNIGALAPDGSAWCSATPISGTLSFADRPYFQEALRTRTFSMSDYLISRVTGQPVIAITYPMLDEAGDVRLVLVAALDLKWLNSLSANAHLPPESAIEVIDRNGTLLAQYPDAGGMGEPLSEVGLLAQIASRPEGTVEYNATSGLGRLYGHTALPGGITVLISISKAAAYAASDWTLRRNLNALLGMSVLGMLAAWVSGTWLIFRPVQKLTQAARQLSAGDLSTRISTTMRAPELQHLAAEFNRMAQALQERTLALTHSRDFYLTLFEEFPALIWRSGLDMQCNYFNRGWLDFTGRTLAQEMGDGWAEGVHPDDFTRCVGLYHSHFAARQPFEMEYRLRHQCGDYRWIVDFGRPFYNLEGEFEGYIGACYDIHERKRAEVEREQLLSKVQTGQEHLRQMTRQLVVAQEEERRRLSRELHDDAGQALIALKIGLELMLTDIPSAAHRATLREAIRLADTTMETVRHLAHNLRPPALDTVGLNPTLEDLCHRFARHARLDVHYTGVEAPRLPEGVSISLYRFAQEALTNVAKHSCAQHVIMDLEKHNGMLELSVRDDGAGFDPALPSAGLGLVGMQERLNALGGQLCIQSGPGEGTRLTARVAWKEAA